MPQGRPFPLLFAGLLLGGVLVSCGADEEGPPGLDLGRTADLGSAAGDLGDLDPGQDLGEAEADSGPPASDATLADSGGGLDDLGEGGEDLGGDSGAEDEGLGSDVGSEDTGQADLGSPDAGASDLGAEDPDLGTLDEGLQDDLGGDLGDSGDPGDFSCETNPRNRYCPLEDLRDAALVAGLNELVRREHSSPLLWDDSKLAIFTDLDLRRGDEGELYAECIYTGEHHPLDGVNLPDFDDFNIEHTWPKSLGAGDEPAKGDLHHLLPVNSRANSYRSSLPFGETECRGGCRWSDPAGSELGEPTAGTAPEEQGEVFEVRPEFRGDVARAMFYFAVRYPEESSPRSFPEWEQVVLRRWHTEDPVDDWERERNDGIEGYQGNRNPFVDRPDLVERISAF